MSTSFNEEGYQPTAYDHIYAVYPDHIRKFVGAASRKVRKDMDSRKLEYDDPAEFRRVVAHTAFRMSRMVAPDMHGTPDMVAPLNQVRVEHLMETAGRTCLPISASGQGNYQEGMPFSAFKTEEGTFILKVGPRIFGGLTLQESLALLIGAGVDAFKAIRVVMRANHFGDSMDSGLHSLPA